MPKMGCTTYLFPERSQENTSMKPNQLVSEAWLKISSDNALYSDQWLCDETWVRVIKKCYPSLPVAISFNCATLNRILTGLSGNHDQSNIMGIYHAKFSTLCPYDGQKRKVSYYFRQVDSAIPSSPTASSDVQDTNAKRSGENLCFRKR